MGEWEWGGGDKGSRDDVGERRGQGEEGRRMTRGRGESGRVGDGGKETRGDGTTEKGSRGEGG